MIAKGVDINLLFFNFGINSFYPLVITLPTIAEPIARGCGSNKFYFTFFYRFKGQEIATTIAKAIKRAIKKRSHRPMYKNNTKNKAKKLRATTFVNAKLEEH